MNGFRVLYNQSGQNATDFTPPDVLLALCHRVLGKYLNLIVVIYPFLISQNSRIYARSSRM